MVRSSRQEQWMSRGVQGSGGNFSETQEARALKQRWELWGRSWGLLTKGLPLISFLNLEWWEDPEGISQKKDALRLETLLSCRKVTKVEPRGRRVRLSAVNGSEEPEVSPVARENPRVADHVTE